jgi:putative cell wall-binding protein
MADMIRRASPLAVVALACALVLAFPPQARAVVNDDTIPGVPMSAYFSDTLVSGSDTYDTFRVYLLEGQTLRVNLIEFDPPASTFDMRLYSPVATDFTGPSVIAAGGTFTYEATIEGWYYLRVRAVLGLGRYHIESDRWFVNPPPTATPERVWGSDRYTTAVRIAEKNFPGWQNCDHVIVASGEDRAAADPLAAAGLSWTYGAPIMLVHSDAVPSAVISALQGIVDANGGATVHVVGGPVSVPQARLDEIESRVGGALTFDRLQPANDRFELAATIARRMDSERPTGHLAPGDRGKFALIANGADYDKFFDALALSSVAANTGYPILLVEKDDIPLATQSAMASLGIESRIIGGGPATVSRDVESALDAGAGTAHRWSGDDRYETAAVIAENSYGMVSPPTPRMLTPANVGVAAKLPDALSGGAFTGLRGGPMLITTGDRLQRAPAAYLGKWTSDMGECYVVGGPASITGNTQTEVKNALIP